MVHGTVVLKSPQNEEEEILLSRHLVTSLGTVPKKSWDIAVWGRSWSSTVLGKCSLGTVLGRCSLGTVLGQSSLGTTQSWDTGPGTVVLGQ